MLRREQDNIINMVFQAWMKYDYAATEAYKTAQNAARESFRTDPRVKELTRALEGAGVFNPEPLAWKVVNNSGMIGSVTYSSAGSVYADMKKAIEAVPKPVTGVWHGSPIMTELTTALGTCKSKWPDIQSPLYTLAADIGSAKSQEAVEVAVRRFTSSIS